MDFTTPKPAESRSLIAGYLRVSWSLVGIDPAQIQLQSVLDFVGSEALDRIVAGILNKNYRRILIDLEKLDRMTTAGADGLLKAATEIRRRSGRVALVGPNPRVLSFIENLGLARQIEVYSTAEEAVRGIEAEL
ncbi:MAG: hypothetical protein FD180_4425 [Planctomycetota bacterium]|nr:MAG: hypothetical protein FD180_4425 [Planctomycetota bacterium]